MGGAKFSPPYNTVDIAELHTFALQYLSYVPLDGDLRADGLDHRHYRGREIVPVFAHAEVEEEFFAGWAMLDEECEAGAV